MNKETYESLRRVVDWLVEFEELYLEGTGLDKDERSKDIQTLSAHADEIAKEYTDI